MKKRSVAAVVILSIITCGIYAWYWAYVVSQDLQAQSGVSKLPPIATLLLLIFVSPVGGALLGYDCNATINAIKEKRGIPQKDNNVLWIILGVILFIVDVGLIQDEINRLVDTNN